MLNLTLSGTAWDGTYELDLDTLKGRELHLVKKVSGVRLGEMESALLADDYDLYVAFSAIVVVRSGKVAKEGAHLVAESLMEQEAGAITATWTADAEDDAGPPEVTLDANGKPESSSTPSDESSDVTPETNLASIGALK